VSYNPDHHRRSIRLRGHDYAQAGAFFVTLCVQGRICLFGHVADGVVELTDIGRIVAEEWERTPALRPNVELDEFIVMPDHVHGIVIITQRDDGATPPDATNTLRSPAHTIGAIMRGFKGAVVRRVGRPIWQRNYYEHIIRSEAALDRIRQYIADNPARWKKQYAPVSAV
jgi:REP element-mobilizing transposase RayT